MSNPQTPPPPDLVPRGRGRRFWRNVLADHELRADELELLAEACRQLDLLDALRAVSEPVVLEGKVNAAIIESRQVRQELRRTLAQLCLPDPEGEEGDISPEAANFRSWRARKAARARWS